MKINFFKFLVWVEYFSHKEASAQVCWISIKIWKSYSSLENFNRWVNQIVDIDDADGDGKLDRYVSI